MIFPFMMQSGYVRCYIPRSILETKSMEQAWFDQFGHEIVGCSVY